MKWVTPVIWVGVGEIEPKEMGIESKEPLGGAMSWTCCRYQGCCYP